MQIPPTAATARPSDPTTNVCGIDSNGAEPHSDSVYRYIVDRGCDSSTYIVEITLRAHTAGLSCGADRLQSNDKAPWKHSIAPSAARLCMLPVEDNA